MSLIIVFSIMVHVYMVVLVHISDIEFATAMTNSSY